jgi:hypothetical protein
MAPLPPLDDPTCLKVAIKINDNASLDSGSRFYVSYSSDAPSGGALNTLSGVVAAAWNSHLASSTSSSEFLAQVQIEDMASDMGATGTWSGTNNGSASGTQLPSSACAVINHKISRKYRGGRPRTYLRAGTFTSLLGTNELTSAFQGTLLTGWEAFIEEILADTTAGITLENIVCVSYYDGSTWTGPTGGPYKRIPTKRTTAKIDGVTSSLVATKLGSQRRRLALG